MCLAVLSAAVASRKFNYFDIAVAVWLIIGLLRGRKRGMSQELLPLLQWVGIVAAAGFFYRPFADLIRQSTSLDHFWSNVCAYVLIGFGVHLVYLWFKQLFAEKLSEKDLFGRGEFYLGMMAGIVRFGCMMLAALALMNSRVESAAELAKTEKFQRDNFSDIRFPTWGKFQHEVLFDSFTGDLVENNLQTLLIASVNEPAKSKSSHTPSIAEKSNTEINDILSKTNK